MKSFLSVCLLAAAIMATRGYTFFEDPIESAPDVDAGPGLSPVKPSEKPNPHDCDCDEVCHELHSDTFPKEIQDEHNYLSYENFPVLCRDASAIFLPPGAEKKKKYVCKQTFDCCRSCNNRFYRCLASKPNTYGFCIRGAYKCMCECIEKKSFNELPHEPLALPGTAATKAPAPPEAPTTGPKGPAAPQATAAPTGVERPVTPV